MNSILYSSLFKRNELLTYFLHLTWNEENELEPETSLEKSKLIMDDEINNHNNNVLQRDSK